MQTNVTGTTWDEAEGLWTITTNRNDRFKTAMWPWPMVR